MKRLVLALVLLAANAFGQAMRVYDTIAEQRDAAITAPATWQQLIYNGTYWQNIALIREDTVSNSGSTGTPYTWPNGCSTVRQTPLGISGSDKYGLLPAANSFPAGFIITYIDSLTTENYGRIWRAKGSDHINGTTLTEIPPVFRAGGIDGGTSTAEFETDGVSVWRVLNTNLSIAKIRSTTDRSVSASYVFPVLPAETSLVGTMPNDDFIAGLVPGGSSDTDPSDGSMSVVTAVGADGPEFDSVPTVPSTDDVPAGYSLQVQSDGSYGWTETGKLGSSEYKILDPALNPVEWELNPDSRVQNAVITLPGDRDIKISDPTASGYDFNLIVKQGGAGGWSITGLPSGSMIGNRNATRNFTLTTTPGAVDWIRGTYTGQETFEWAWTLFATNMTAIPPPTCSTPSVVGATTGTAAINQAATQRRYLANNFIATDVSLCKVEANWRKQLLPNYQLKAYICPDDVRIPGGVSGTSTNGNNTVTISVPNSVLPEDVGQRVTGPGIPAGTYVGSIDTAVPPTFFTLSSSRTTNTSRNAGSGAGAGTFNIYGKPGTPINPSGSDPVSTVGLPTATTGTGSADDDAAYANLAFTFPTGTGTSVFGMTAGDNYWLVIGTAASFVSPSWDANNYAEWFYDTTPATGFKFSRANALPVTGSGTWVSATNPARKARFRTYK